MQARILCIERKRAESPSFIPGLRKKGFLVETVTTGAEAVLCLSQFKPDLVIVNAASLRTNGKRICKALRESLSNLPIVLIIDSIHNSNEEDCANVILKLPFTARKLVNRITPFLHGNPDSIIKAGLIQLDMDRKTVNCGELETRLTPRLANLLKILMEHQGEAVTRETLFTVVWKTSYTGDTRTLDVHISWLRHAIEKDPRRPVFLKTIRGVGYRLDI